MKKKDKKEQERAQTSRPGNIYDVYVKDMFSRVWLFNDFLESYADWDFVRDIDTSNITLMPTHYISLGGREQILDLLFSCSLKNQVDVKVVIIFEHAGNSIEGLPSRLLHYASSIWREEDNNGAEMYSAIYFIVLRTGKKPYVGVFPSFSQKLPKLADGSPAGYDPMVPYLVVDLPAKKENELPGKPALRAMMGVLKCVTEGREEDFKKAMSPLSKFDEEDMRVLLEESILNFVDKAYNARGKKLTEEDIREALTPIEGERADKMVKSFFEEIEDRGIMIGEARGEARGEAIGKADTLLRGVRKRFTNAPKRIESTIRQISDLGKLDSLIDYIFASRTLDEFEAALK
jgi:hypothetical protein